LLRVPEDFGGCGELGPDLLLHAEGAIEDAGDALRARHHVAGCAVCREWLASQDALTRTILETLDDRTSRERRRSVERILTGVRALSAAKLVPERPGPRTPVPRRSPALRRRPLYRVGSLAAAASLAVAALVFLGSPSPAPGGRPHAGAGSRVAMADAADGRRSPEPISGGIRWLLGTVREGDSLGIAPTESERIHLVGLRPSGGPSMAPARFVEAVRGARPGQDRCFLLSTGSSSAIEIIPRSWYDLEGEEDPVFSASRECRVIIVSDPGPAGPVLQVFTLEDSMELDAETGGYTPGWLGPPRQRRGPYRDLPALPATWQP
jgi:hypothetical protein